MAFAVYAVGSFICHQRPERSFHLWGAALPVCARCSGIYVGATAAPLLKWVIVRWQSGVAPVQSLVAAALPTTATLVYEWTAGATPSNWIRAAAAVPLGMVAAAHVLRSFDSR